MRFSLSLILVLVSCNEPLIDIAVNVKSERRQRPYL